MCLKVPTQQKLNTMSNGWAENLKAGRMTLKTQIFYFGPIGIR